MQHPKMLQTTWDCCTSFVWVINWHTIEIGTALTISEPLQNFQIFAVIVSWDLWFSVLSLEALIHFKHHIVLVENFRKSANDILFNINLHFFSFFIFCFLQWLLRKLDELNKTFTHYWNRWSWNVTSSFSLKRFWTFFN